MVVNRFDVYLVNLDPTIGTEIQKTRPCVVISPDEVNRHIATVIIAPMTTRVRLYPSRVQCRFEGKDGQVVLDQIRTVDNLRLAERLGRANRQTQEAVLLCGVNLLNDYDEYRFMYESGLWQHPLAWLDHQAGCGLT